MPIQDPWLPARLIIVLLALAGTAVAQPPDPLDGTPVRGLWLNPDRPGQGFDLHRSPGTRDYVLVWYGHDDRGAPTWYLGEAPLEDGRLNFEMLRFSWRPGASEAHGEPVGSAVLEFANPGSATISWDLPGLLGTETTVPFTFDDGVPLRTGSGLWADPEEPGWGLSLATQGAWTIAIQYFYDPQGNPTWLIGQGSDPNAPLTLLEIAAPGSDGTVVGTPRATLSVDLRPDGTLDARGDLEAWPVDAGLARLTEPLYREGGDSVETSAIAFVGVDVLTMAAPPVLENQVVTARHQSIAAVEPVAAAAVPQGTVLIRADGAWLMPGLVDAHVHLVVSDEHVENDLFTILANGVTTVRQMWGQRGIRELRDAIDGGELVGPRILSASPGIEGPQSYWPQTLVVSTPGEARAAVRQMIDDGFDFIKVYSRLSLANYEAIVGEADAAGVAVVGHVSNQVGLDRAMTGHRSIEHLMGYPERLTESGLASWAAPLSVVRVGELAAASAAAGVWNVPTQVVIDRATSDIPRITGSRDWRLLSPAYRSWFLDPLTQPGGRSAAVLANRLTMIRALWQAGAPLAVGTDSGVRYVLPGPSMLEEMANFRAAGIPPLDTLRAATVNGATMMGREDEFGSIRVGLDADLLLLPEDPRADPTTFSRMLGVMARGRWWSRTAIDARLDEIEASYPPENR